MTNQELLDLLEECLPFLEFCVGGANVDATLRKVATTLQRERNGDATCTLPNGGRAGRL